MKRPSRPHVTALLWLVLALLPLRGWALAMMSQQAQPAVASAQVQPSCHSDGAVLEASEATQRGHDGHAGVCHLCDLCHSAMAAAQAAPEGVQPQPVSAPVERGLAAPPAEPAGDIYKPPRL